MAPRPAHARFARSLVVALGVYVACFVAAAQTPVVTPPTAPAPAAPVQDVPGRDPGRFEGADLTPKDPIVPVSPEEQRKRFLLQPGYRVEPVLTEPEVQEPTQIAFDGNGRMFVLEIRAYMQDADATGELEPVGRISVHEDVNNDGVYEKHSVFVDKLVFPRFVLPFGANSILTMESNQDEVWRYTDTNGDGAAEKKELFTTGFGRAGNVEHQQASLTWGMDNWLYSTYNAFRIRWTPNGILKEPTGANGAQWGVTQDDHGKLWFQGGASGLPSYFQLPIHYGNFRVPGQLAPGFEIPWGVAGLGDFEPGTSAIRKPELTLNSVTGAAGNDIVRGHRMPNDLLGDYLYGEPVARIVRRVRPVVTEGLTQLQNVHQWEHSEFIRSTDHLFRPVDIATAPDGTAYIVDLYRGIIQEGTWTQPGSYLRAKIDQFQLARIVRRGRIWRLSHESTGRDRRQPRMLNETASQLVAHLEHPNGWWRDTAQQLLVLKQDMSVVPALQRMARSSPSLFGRFHAMWTLEGLGALDAAIVRQQMEDPNPKMRVQAIRLSETLYKAGDRSWAADYRRLATDTDADVAIQAMLTMNVLKVPELTPAVQAAQAANPARGVQEIGRQILNPPPLTYGRSGGGAFSADQLSAMERGDAIYKELCFSCHGEDGRGTPVPGAPAGAIMAPSLVGNLRITGHSDYVVKTLLHGLIGPIDGRTYAGGVMAPMGSNTDEWIASAASYVRNAFGNAASFVWPADVARVRTETAARTATWTHDQLVASVPALVPIEPTWKATASHNTDNAAQAFNFATWSTRVPQVPGMWFQVELPQPTLLTELQFESSRSGGGRGGPPPTSGYPREYTVQVSADGAAWTSAASGEGRGVSTAIRFAPVQARFVRITQTATIEGAPPWSILRFRVYRPGVGS
ncbi:MAG: discoidin domain-containing protein [Acidobacteriota bacterium]|nr:discoidin domain-containing protein [Acidobacteriota bacterium]